MSVCLGPFSTSPQGLSVTLQCRDFTQSNLFRNPGRTTHTKIVVQDKSSGAYYLLLSMPDELVINEDICVMIQTSSAGKIAALNFRFWLNARYLDATRVIVPNDLTNVNDFVPLTRQQKDCVTLVR